MANSNIDVSDILTSIIDIHPIASEHPPSRDDTIPCIPIEDFEEFVDDVDYFPEWSADYHATPRYHGVQLKIYPKQRVMVECLNQPGYFNSEIPYEVIEKYVELPPNCAEPCFATCYVQNLQLAIETFECKASVLNLVNLARYLLVRKKYEALSFSVHSIGNKSSPVLALRMGCDGMREYLRRPCVSSIHIRGRSTFSSRYLNDAFRFAYPMDSASGTATVDLNIIICPQSVSQTLWITGLAGHAFSEMIEEVPIDISHIDPLRNDGHPAVASDSAEYFVVHPIHRNIMAGFSIPTCTIGPFAVSNILVPSNRLMDQDDNGVWQLSVSPTDGMQRMSMNEICIIPRGGKYLNKAAAHCPRCNSPTNSKYCNVPSCDAVRLCFWILFFTEARMKFQDDVFSVAGISPALTGVDSENLRLRATNAYPDANTFLRRIIRRLIPGIRDAQLDSIAKSIIDDNVVTTDLLTPSIRRKYIHRVIPMRRMLSSRALDFY